MLLARRQPDLMQRMTGEGHALAATVIACVALFAGSALPSYASARTAPHRPGGHHRHRQKPTSPDCLGTTAGCTFVTTNVTDNIGGGRFIVRQHAVRYGFGVFVVYTCDDGSTSTMLTGFSQTVPVTGAGDFSYDGYPTADLVVHVTGHIHGRTASGTIDGTLSGNPNCHGSANWTATAGRGGR